MKTAPGPSSSRELSQLVARYVDHLRDVYSSREWMNVRSALARLVTQVDRLTFEQLRDAARSLAIDTTLSKNYRRGCIARWKRFLAWCSEELVVDASVVDRFRHVRLRFPEQKDDPDPDEPRRGRADRSAPDPRRDPEAFADVFFDALPHLSRETRDVVQVLAFTGARPIEILSLRTLDINTSSTPWIARLDRHKTSASTDAPRILVFNRSARRVLDRRLTPFTPEDWLFPAPKNAARAIARDLVQRRLRRELTRAELPTWTLYDLRRWTSTIVRGAEGLDAAQALLGHSRSSTTEIYAPPLFEHAIRAAEALERRAAS